MNEKYWNGFIYESKRYMSYDRMNRREKIRFWRRLPIAAIKFYIWYPFNDTAKMWRTRVLWMLETWNDD